MTFVRAVITVSRSNECKGAYYIVRTLREYRNLLALREIRVANVRWGRVARLVFVASVIGAKSNGARNTNEVVSARRVATFPTYFTASELCAPELFS